MRGQVKQGNFSRWGASEYMILSNYNMRRASRYRSRALSYGVLSVYNIDHFLWQVDL